MVETPSGGSGVVVHRLSEVADAPGVVGLIVEHARYEGGTTTREGLVNRLDAWITGGRLDVFVAADGADLVGYAALTRDVATWTGVEYGHLDCLFVTAAARGRGTGALLVAAVLARCGELGLRQLQWQTPAWNVDAIRFYRRTGAEDLPKQRFMLAVPGTA